MPTYAADLDGPVYQQRERVVIERATPRVIERERVIEHYVYAPREVIPPSYDNHRVFTPYNYADGYRGYRPDCKSLVAWAPPSRMVSGAPH